MTCSKINTTEWSNVIAREWHRTNNCTSHTIVLQIHNTHTLAEQHKYLSETETERLDNGAIMANVSVDALPYYRVVVIHEY